MSENLPYEEQINRRFEDDKELPLPDMDQSWQKMQALMHEDKKRRFLPPLFLNGCIVGLFLIGLVVLTWVFLKPGEQSARNNLERTKQVENAMNLTRDANKSNNTPASSAVIGDKTTNQLSKESHKVNVAKKQTQQDLDKRAKVEIANNKVENTNKNFAGRLGKDAKANKPPAVKGRSTKVIKAISIGMADVKVVDSNKRLRRNLDHEPMDAKKPVQKNQPLKTAGETSLANKTVEDSKINTSGATTPTTSTVDSGLGVMKKDLLVKDSSTAESERTVTKESKAFLFAAGIALQQQIPLKGQKAVPYNIYGRTGSLADYIPSVYLRLYRQKKWFLQTEFRYGAPQNTKQIDYNKQKLDSVGASVTSRSLQLRKTYYHQIPVTFNYFILPNLSLGAGIMYSKFYGALAEEQISNTNLITQQDSLIKKAVVKIPSGTDSFFTKSQLHAVIEGQYQWKRFSAGFRYTAGLQPFIKYTSSAGEQKSEKNQSMQVFIRYELWRSRKNR